MSRYGLFDDATYRALLEPRESASLRPNLSLNTGTNAESGVETKLLQSLDLVARSVLFSHSTFDAASWHAFGNAQDAPQGRILLNQTYSIYRRLCDERRVVIARRLIDEPGCIPLLCHESGDLFLVTPYIRYPAVGAPQPTPRLCP